MSALLQARAYKRELIQFVVGDDGAMALGLNFAFMLRDLGYDHWFAFGGRDNSSCVKFMQALPDGGQSLAVTTNSPLMPDVALLWLGSTHSS